MKAKLNLVGLKRELDDHIKRTNDYKRNARVRMDGDHLSVEYSRTSGSSDRRFTVSDAASVRHEERRNDISPWVPSGYVSLHSEFFDWYTLIRDYCTPYLEAERNLESLNWKCKNGGPIIIPNGVVQIGDYYFTSDNPNPNEPTEGTGDGNETD